MHTYYNSTDYSTHTIIQQTIPHIQNPLLTAQSTQIKSVISVPIKDFIHHYPRALFNDIPRVGAYFYDIPGSVFHTYYNSTDYSTHTIIQQTINSTHTIIQQTIPHIL